MRIRNKPILTEVYETPAGFSPEHRSSYVYAWSPEERSHHIRDWQGLDVEMLAVVQEDSSSVTVRNLGNDSQTGALLRSPKQLRGLWSSRPGAAIYIDITGLPHHVWAPLLRSSLASNRFVRVVYVEPRQYTLNLNPTEGMTFDLTESFSGIAPIPGFTTLTEDEERFCFVPLLGFEGPRFTYLVEKVQPRDDDIIPVIGVPGFRPQYPFYTYWGNRFSLRDTYAWRSVHYASANCPFSAYYVLEEISNSHINMAMKIAPIGTKPHALGAVLFVLSHPARQVELVYDHPVRKPSRTSGAARLLVYDISAFSTNTNPL